MQTTTGNILGEATRLIGLVPAVSAMYVMLNTAASVSSDIPGLEGVGTMTSSIVGLALGYVLVASMVVAGGLVDQKKAGFLPYFGMGILTSLGIGLGLIFLIVPGIFLLVRWTAAYGFLFAEGEGVTKSMTSSYHLTEGSFWPLLGAIVIPSVLAIGAVAAMIFWTGDEGQILLPASIAANLAISVAGLLFTAIGLGFYSLKRSGGDRLEQIFE